MKDSLKGAVVLAFSAILSLGLVACGGSAKESADSEPQEPVGGEKVAAEPADLVLKESGYTISEDGYVYYGVVIENPNEEYKVEFPEIQITGKDEEGKIVFSDIQTLNSLLAKGTCAYASQAGNGTAPATVEFALSVASRNWEKDSTQNNEMYTISNVNEVVGDYNLDFTGEVTANVEPQNEFSSVAISVLLRNDEGQIVGGMTTFVDDLANGQTKPFDLWMYCDVPYSSYEVYAQPW